MSSYMRRFKKIKFVLIFVLTWFLGPNQLNASKLPGLREIRAFYPNLSNLDFQAKLDGTSYSFHFLRTFVPLYYQIVKDNPAPELLKTQLFNISGLCVGDAHPENFGILLSDSGVPIFTVNDFDDGGKCFIFADMLRFFVATYIYDPNVDLIKLLNSYLGSLSGGSFEISEVVQKMATMSAGKLESDRKNLESNSRFKRELGSIEVSPSEFKSIQTLVTLRYGVNAQVIDAVSFKKLSGGSGGLLRFRVLVQFYLHLLDQTQIIEFKELQEPGIFPMAAGPIMTSKTRLENLIGLEEGREASQLFSIEKILGREMLLRPRRLGQIGISLADLKNKDDRAAVLNDEAAIFGRIHIRAVEDLDLYKNELLKVSVSEWQNIIKRYAADIDTVFKNIKTSVTVSREDISTKSSSRSQ